MRKLVMAGLLAAAVVAALPDRSYAHGRSPYNHHGLGWLQSFAYRRLAWIHMNGPLYSYGPYNTPGYLTMHIPQAYHGYYTPADPNLWNLGYGARGPNVPAPAAGYPPDGVPGGGPPQPYFGAGPGGGMPPPGFGPPGEGFPQPFLGASPRPTSPDYTPPRILPAVYDSVYPGWMNGR